MGEKSNANQYNAKTAIEMLMPHNVECTQSICHTQFCPGGVLV